MRGFNDIYFESLTAAVADAEEQTSVEIVVAVEPCSGNYRDVDFAAGAAAALAGLLVALYGPWSHPEWAVLIDIILLFAAGAWISSAIPAVRRALTRTARRDAQVRSAAAAAFHREGVTQTLERTGLLIYVSVLEHQVVALPDRGVVAAVPAPVWNSIADRLRRIMQEPDPPAGLLNAMGEMARALAGPMPPTGDNPDELPNQPRRQR